MRNNYVASSVRRRRGRKYKALMIDLDGTTVPYESNAVPSQRVIDAVTKAQKILHVGVATGRTYPETKRIFDYLSLSGPSIISGGAQIIEAPDYNVIWESRLDEKSVAEIEKIFKKHKEKVFVNDELSRESVVLAKSPHRKNPLNVWNPALEEEIADTIVSDLSSIPTISSYKIRSWQTGKFTVQVVNLTATKQHGIFEVAKILGIDTHEIIGVGDSYNDFPLLMASGLKIAIGNAAPELKKIADFVAPSVDDDGVAVVIEKFILEK